MRKGELSEQYGLLSMMVQFSRITLKQEVLGKASVWVRACRVRRYCLTRRESLSLISGAYHNVIPSQIAVRYIGLACASSLVTR